MRALAIAVSLLVWVVGGCAGRGPAVEDNTALLPGTGSAAPALEPWVPVLAPNPQAGGYELRAVDPTTGIAPASDPPAPIQLGRGENGGTYARSADGKWLAVPSGAGRSCERYAGGTACRPRVQELHIVDVQAWSEVTATLPISGWAGPMAFSPDAGRLALVLTDAGRSTLLALDAGTGRAIAHQAIDIRPSLLGYGAGGAELVVYGQAPGADPGIGEPPPPAVLVLDAATLDTRWEHTLDGVTSGEWCADRCDADHGARVTAYFRPAAVLARDGNSLIVAHAGDERLTVVDLAGQSVRTVAITRAQSWLERLLAPATVHAKGPMQGAIVSAVLSADGSRLYVSGQIMEVSIDSSGTVRDESKPLGLRVIDPQTGRVLAKAAAAASDVWSTPDAALLVAESWQSGEPRTEVLASGGLEVVGRVSGWEVVAVGQSEDGLVLVARRFEPDHESYAAIDASTQRVLAEWEADGYWTWLVGR